MRKWPCICFGLLLLAASLTGCSDRDSAAASGSTASFEQQTSEPLQSAEENPEPSEAASVPERAEGRRNAGGICRNPNCFHDKRYQSGRADGRL